MSQSQHVGAENKRSWTNVLIGASRGTALNTTGNTAVTIPILGGGLTNGGGVGNSGAVIVRRVTIQNPSGSVASANIALAKDNTGVNLITANTVISSVSATGTFQDITPTATLVSGANTEAMYVIVNTASGNGNTVDICVYGDVVSF